MSSLRLALIGLAPLVLAACAGVRSPPPTTGIAAAPGPASSYGLFLAGQAAVNAGDSASAETLFAQAAASHDGPTDEAFLHGQAFTYALLAGDIARAAAIAPTGPGADAQLVQVGALVRGVEALAEGKGKAAVAAIKLAQGGKATAIGAGLLAPYAAAEAGDVEGSIASR